MMSQKKKSSNFVDKSDLSQVLSLLIRIPANEFKKCQGYAFCEFISPELAECAIRNLNGRELKSKLIRKSYSGQHN